MGNVNRKKQNQNTEEYKDDEVISYNDIYIPSLFKYKHSDRRMPYSTEEMELSKQEEKLISKLKADKINLTEFPENTEEITKIIIDTDLGTDWDDAMAILYALHMPNLEILGITTNYGIPELRAKVIQKIIDAYMKNNPGKNNIPVIAGASQPLGSHRELLIYGHEGLPFFEEFELKNNLKMKNIINRKQTNASEFIASTVKKYPNQVKIVSIGIPTNIGLALSKNKEIIPLIKEIIIMGCGSFITDEVESDNLNDYVINGNKINLYPNHNISGDTLATKILFDSCIPTKIIDHSVSSKFWAEGPVIEFLRQKASEIKDIKNPENPEGAVGLLMNEWFKRRRQNGQCPHDPLTVHEAIYGGNKSPIIYARGRVVSHEWAAFSTFIPQENGPHYLGLDIKKDNKFLEILANTIMNDGNNK